MKAETICTIKDILEQKTKDATNNYRNNEAILKQKYGDDFDKLMTHFEKVKFTTGTSFRVFKKT